MLALIALSLPTLLILVVATFYSRIEDKPIVYRATRGLMLGIIGLTLGTLWGIGQSTITVWLDVAIVLIALGLALTKKVPVILILALAAVAGLVFYGG